MNEEDRSSLLGFVDSLEHLLAVAIHEDRKEEEFRELLLAAWVDLVLGSPERPGAFSQLRNAIQSTDFDRQLEEHGLHGVQLQAKLQPFHYFSQRVIAMGEDARSRRPTLWRRFVDRIGSIFGVPVVPPFAWFLRRALAWGNVTLGSIVASIPFSGAIKEFKEVLEASLDDETTGPGRHS